MKYKPPKNVAEKSAKKENIKNFWKIFAVQGVMFLITSALAVAGAFALNRLVALKKVYLPTTSLQDFIFSFLFITFFVLIFVSFKKAGRFKGFVYKALFIIAVFWGAMTLLNLFLPTFAAIILVGILIALWLELPSVWVHDILMVLGLSGAASFFGLGFVPSVVVGLLLIFSVYDFIAVYKTKHMVAMAKEMIEKKVIFGFIIPKELKYFKDKLSQVKQGGNFIILGGGDVVFPSLLAVSLVPEGMAKAWIIVLFSFFGSLFSYYIFTKEHEPIPALPPIALFSIIGYLVTLFI